jgi:hypothetical protein
MIWSKNPRRLIFGAAMIDPILATQSPLSFGKAAFSASISIYSSFESDSISLSVFP